MHRAERERENVPPGRREELERSLEARMKIEREKDKTLMGWIRLNPLAAMAAVGMPVVLFLRGCG